MALINATAIPNAADYEIEQSLRLTSPTTGSTADASAGKYLKRVPTSTSNRKTATLSCWLKRSVVDQIDVVIAFGESQKQHIRFQDDLDIRDYNDGSSVFGSAGVYRDVSAWYHLVVAIDTTQGTAGNRVKAYINGESVTSGSYTAPTQNQDWHFNTSGQPMYIGVREWSNATPGTIIQGFEGYLAEFNWIDGQALTPADFGETGDYGEWKPIEYSGTYGTNGFYLPFKQDYTVEGFSTVTYKGNESTMYVGGTGFQPDLVWFKQRDGTRNHTLIDSVRGGTKQLFSNSTGSEETYATAITSFDTDGFTIGSQYNINEDNKSMVAWNWDMGGSNATNTTGDITSTVRANPTYGQSIVSWSGTGSGSSPTIGHGLSSAPDCIIVKRRSSANGAWPFLHEFDTTKYLQFQDVDAASTGATVFDNTAPTSSVFTVNATNAVVNASGHTYIAYCWHSVTGYSKFGSYTGNGSTTNAVTTGFKPAFVMVKRTDATNNWLVYDNTRSPTNPNGHILFPNLSNAESVETSNNIVDFDSNGFTLKSNLAATNASGGTYVYMAFADKREYAYWLDQSGNNNDWTSNNLTESDISVDSPTNNFATYNPLHAPSTGTFSEGNLKHAAGGQVPNISSMAMASGKWYAEFYCVSGVHTRVGIANELSTGIYGGNLGATAGSWAKINNAARLYHSGNVTTYGAEWDAGQIAMVAFDADAGKIWYGVDGVWDASGNPATAANPSQSSVTGTDFFFATTSGSGTLTYVANFGQDSSFAANKTAQGNQDGNDIGDFYYTPPTGFLALCTKNLPDVAVTPQEHFNAVLYSGNGGTQSITGVGFQPDLIWKKATNEVRNHYITDAVRGVQKTLSSNTNGAEDSSTSYVTAFGSDGWSMGATSAFNKSSINYVAWNWKANGSGSSNTNGSITSTVSASVDAGFSIVTYTGNGTAGATIGHGLSKTPDIVFVKRRNSTGNTLATMPILGNNYLQLTTNEATIAHAVYFNNTLPTATVFSVGTANDANANTGTHIAYCFHSVDGYSKVGSYTGNGSTDGTFVYTGFRPAWVMIKRTGDTSGWVMYDNKRDTYNAVGQVLYADTSGAESDTRPRADLLSNGFKLRSATEPNWSSGNPIIYIAFAETPFKYSNAR